MATYLQQSNSELTLHTVDIIIINSSTIAAWCRTAMNIVQATMYPSHCH